MALRKAHLIPVIFTAMAVLAIGSIRYFYYPVVISGSSMSPTLHDGDIYFTDTNITKEKLTYETIIVFESHENIFKKYVKRIAGLPGDRIVIRDKMLYRNGERVGRYGNILDPGDYGKETEIPEDEYFVLGDNVNISNDSRKIGTIKFSDVKAILREDEAFRLP